MQKRSSQWSLLQWHSLEFWFFSSIAARNLGAMWVRAIWVMIKLERKGKTTGVLLYILTSKISGLTHDFRKRYCCHSFNVPMATANFVQFIPTASNSNVNGASTSIWVYVCERHNVALRRQYIVIIIKMNLAMRPIGMSLPGVLDLLTTYWNTIKPNMHRKT